MPNRHQRRVAKRSPGDTRDRTGSGFTQFARERPLLIVAAGIALGMALGALLPWKLMEEELLGEQAEKLKDGALELASEGYEKAKSVAQRGYEAATEVILNRDGSGKSPVSTGLPGASTASVMDRHHS